MPVGVGVGAVVVVGGSAMGEYAPPGGLHRSDIVDCELAGILSSFVVEVSTPLTRHRRSLQ